MGPTAPKLVTLAALLQLFAVIPELARQPRPGSFTVMGLEGEQMAHWAFNIQTGLWPAVYLLAMAIGLEILRRIAHALEGQAAPSEERQ